MKLKEFRVSLQINKTKAMKDKETIPLFLPLWNTQTIMPLTL
jgi:hypothetical protein